MAEIVNLRTERKRRQRDEQARRADENRARHGRTKAQRELDRDTSEKLRAHVEAHRRKGEDDGSGK